jgi:hypothetical protein
MTHRALGDIGAQGGPLGPHVGVGEGRGQGQRLPGELIPASGRRLPRPALQPADGVLS